jgi:hypothetical protein
LRKIVRGLGSLTIAALFTFPVVAQKNPATWEWQPVKSTANHHRFFDKQNSRLFVINAVSQTFAMIAIQSHGAHPESRGRTLDGFEKHFESYGYGWGACYRLGGGGGLNMFSTLIFHGLGHTNLNAGSHSSLLFMRICQQDTHSPDPGRAIMEAGKNSYVDIARQ